MRYHAFIFSNMCVKRKLFLTTLIEHKINIFPCIIYGEKND